MGSPWHLDVQRREKVCEQRRVFVWFYPCLPVRFSEIESLSLTRYGFEHIFVDIHGIFHYVKVSVHFLQHRQCAKERLLVSKLNFCLNWAEKRNLTLWMKQ